MSIHVDWAQYNTLVEKLAFAVHESGFRFNQIICIARGGLRVGDVLSRIFDQPLAILSTHSYTAEGSIRRGSRGSSADSDETTRSPWLLK